MRFYLLICKIVHRKLKSYATVVFSLLWKTRNRESNVKEIELVKREIYSEGTKTKKLWNVNHEHDNKANSMNKDPESNSLINSRFVS